MQVTDFKVSKVIHLSMTVQVFSLSWDFFLGEAKVSQGPFVSYEVPLVWIFRIWKCNIK